MPKGKPRALYPEEYMDEPKTPVADQPKLSIEEVLTQLKGAESEKDSTKALSQIGDALARLTDEDRDKLLATPAVVKLVEDARRKAQREGRPGTVVCDSSGRVLERVEWTRDAMKDEWGLVEWTPMRTTWITVQGVSVYVRAAEPTITPPQFRDVAMESFHLDQQSLDTQKKLMQQSFGPTSMILSGDGSVVYDGRSQN